MAGRLPGGPAAVPHLRGAGPQGRTRLAGSGEADAENPQVRYSEYVCSTYQQGLEATVGFGCV